MHRFHQIAWLYWAATVPLLPWNRNKKLSGQLIVRRLFQRDRAARTACARFVCAATR